MSNRVTGAEVKQIFQTSLSAAEVEYFITATELLVTEYLSDSGLSDAHLAQIQLYLTAHFASSWDQRIKSQKFGDSQADFQHYAMSDVLGSTDYGQKVILLDTTGTLLSSIGKKGISVQAMGAAVDMTGHGDRS